MQKIGFIIDGFNLYHSLDEVYRKDKTTSTKWLDLVSFLNSFVSPIGNELGVKTKLESVDYFSALATHLTLNDQEKVIRHKDYIKCLEHTGVSVHLGRFKKKKIKYANNKCSVCLETHEEKETDVGLAIKAFELFHTNSIDILAIVSGDSDLVPAVKTVKKHFPAKSVVAIFPAGRKSDDLQQAVDASFKTKEARYSKHQLQDPFQLATFQISKPNSW